MTVFGPDDVLTFGKYKGCVLRNVIEMKPRYVHWARSTIEWFKLSDEAKALMPTQIPRRASGGDIDDHDMFDEYEHDTFVFGNDFDWQS